MTGNTNDNFRSRQSFDLWSDLEVCVLHRMWPRGRVAPIFVLCAQILEVRPEASALGVA